MKTFFSKRTEWDLRQNPLTCKIQQWEREGRAYIDMTQTNPTKCNIAYPQEALSSLLVQEESFQYHLSPKGLLSARKAIAGYYRTQDVEVNPEHIFITSSTSEAYGYLLRLMTNPGDHILVPIPSYPLFDFLADCNDVVLTRYPLNYDHGWSIDFDSLEKLIEPYTRVLMLVNPNNPTGSYIKREDMDQLIALAHKHQLCLVCDEVFFDYAYMDLKEKTRSLAAYSDVPVCVLNGFSKMLALPQLKAAWMLIHGPEEFRCRAIERMEIISDTFLSVNTPVQVAMAGLFDLRAGIQTQIKARLEGNRLSLTRMIHQFPACSYLHAEGGWYAIVRVPAVINDDAWSMRLLDQHGVLAHPGHYYHIREHACLVISLLCEENIFKKGLQRIFSAVGKYCQV